MDLTNFTLAQKRALYGSLNRQVRQGRGDQMTSHEWNVYSALSTLFFHNSTTNI